MKRKIRVGDVVEISWLDACFYSTVGDVDVEAFNRGGEICVLTGVVARISEKSILIVGELDEERQPMRDFNLIPRCLIIKSRKL